ncbi:hypothetical protein C9414_19480, partial [Bacillus sp. Nf3]
MGPQALRQMPGHALASASDSTGGTRVTAAAVTRVVASVPAAHAPDFHPHIGVHHFAGADHLVVARPDIGAHAQIEEVATEVHVGVTGDATGELVHHR